VNQVLFYLIVFFVIAYLVNASLMVAVGPVNEMKEAQSLMMTIMLTLMAPWILAQPISRDPNSTLGAATRRPPRSRPGTRACGLCVSPASSLQPPASSLRENLRGPA
jgi:hypothetical protein